MATSGIDLLDTVFAPVGTEAGTVVDSLYNSLAPMWIEVCFMIFFLLGFATLRPDLLKTRARSLKKAKKLADEPASAKFNPRLKRAVESEEAPERILAVWKAGRSHAPTPADLLRPVTQALAELEPQSLAEQIADHVREHRGSMCHACTAVTVLDVAARAGLIEAMEDLHEAFRRQFGVHPTLQVYEVLLGGYATAADERKVALAVAELSACRFRMSARGLSLMIKGFLKNGMVDQVLEQFREMCRLGYQVPPFAVTQLFRIACDAGRAQEVFEQVRELVALPAEALAHVLEDCVKRWDLALARRLDRAAQEGGVPLLVSSYDSLLKLYTVAGDQRAVDLFAQMQGAGARISEGLCVGLLARCAEAKFLRFAEEIVRFSRARGRLSLVEYSALMKVYAYCGMYDKACDLYDRLTEEGLRPDSIMYGCLMKFAVECGRTDLSQRLAEETPVLDIQQYMSLIRAAGRDKDVDRAFALLEKLKTTSGARVDTAAFNCVLDVCVNTGELARAQRLVEDMRNSGHLDIIGYNTLLKGFTVRGDIPGAKEILAEMVREGFKPNDVSYNCILNAAVSMRVPNLKEAWDTIDLMESNGVKADSYTLSIMMKALKRLRNPRDVARTLALLDRTGIAVHSDEILMNTVLETCIRHREHRRLDTILKEFTESGQKASVQTYSSLIKACSTLGRLPQCWAYWREMEARCDVEPNDISLGCMLDALICNRAVEQAVELLSAWKGRVQFNTVIYSTIIKGFANTHQPDRAMEMWRQIRKEGLKMNTVVYNAVIDAQARVGAMDEVSELVAAMEADGVVPDAISHSTIVKGYCMKGDLDRAFEVLRGMQTNKLAKDSIVYNTLLDGCTRYNRFDLADVLLADMEKHQIAPSNFTVGSLVKMWGRRENLDNAFELIENLPPGCTANPQVLTCLIGACLNNHRLDRALEVFEDLKQKGGADVKAFSSMISGCIRSGKLDKAASLVEDAYGLSPGARMGLPAGAHIEAPCLEKLMQELHRRGKDKDVAIPLLDKLRAAGVPISGRLCSSVFGGGGRPAGSPSGSPGGSPGGSPDRSGAGAAPRARPAATATTTLTTARGRAGVAARERRS